MDAMRVRASCWNPGRFFVSAEAAEDWLAQYPTGTVLPVADAYPHLQPLVAGYSIEAAADRDADPTARRFGSCAARRHGCWSNRGHHCAWLQGGGAFPVWRRTPAQLTVQRLRRIWSAPGSNSIGCSPRRTAPMRGPSQLARRAGPTSSCCSNGVRLHGRPAAARSRAGVRPTARSSQPPLRQSPRRCNHTVSRRSTTTAPAQPPSSTTVAGWAQNSIASSLHCNASWSGKVRTALHRGMHFPQRWDPFFTDYMTLADVYRYPSQHFDYHARQLALS